MKTNTFTVRPGPELIAELLQDIQESLRRSLWKYLSNDGKKENLSFQLRCNPLTLEAPGMHLNLYNVAELECLYPTFRRLSESNL